MLNKVLAGMIVAFWLAMMAALVRVEIFPKPTALETIPNERILKKIFANADPGAWTCTITRWPSGFAPSASNHN